MATRGEELNTRITATDEASAVVDRVADAVGELEDKPHDVKIGADTEQAEAEARQLDQRLKGLTDDEKRVVLRLMAQDAQRDIDRFNKDLARAEKFSDQEIAMRIEARDNASKKLDAIQAEVRELDGASPTVRVNVSGDDQLRALLDDLDGRAGGIGGRLAGLGVNSPVVAGVAAVGAGLVLAAQHAADVAIRADEIAKLTGDSVENASRLAAVMKSSGVETKDLQDILLQMGGVLTTNKELVAQLGINMNDGRTLGERFVQVVDLLATKFDDAGERSVIASQLFGEEGVRQVNSVIARVGDLGQAIRDIPQAQVVSPSDVEAAREMQANIAKIKTDVESIGNTLGRPVVEGLGLITSGLAKVGSDAQELGLDIARALSNTRQENDRIITSWNNAEQAAASFDRTLLDGLTTFDQVHAKVLELTGDVTAANIVAVEWNRTNGDVNDTMSNQVGVLRRVVEAAREHAAAIAEQQAAWDALGVKIDDTKTDVEEFEQALRNAFDTQVQGLIQGVIDKVNEADQKVRDRLSLEGLIDDIKAQFGEVNEAAAEAGDGGEDAARRHREAVRQLRRMMLDLIGDLEHLSARDRIRLVAEVERSSVDGLFALLGTLTQGITVPVSFTQTPQPGFTGANISVGGGKTPSLDFAGVQSAIPSGNVYVFPPIGSTPVTSAEQGRDYLRQFGNRMSPT